MQFCVVVSMVAIVIEEGQSGFGWFVGVCAWPLFICKPV